MTEAEKVKDLILIYEWYGFISNFYTFYGKASNFKNLRERYLQNIKDIYVRSGTHQDPPKTHENLRVIDEEKLKILSTYCDEELLKVMGWFVV